MMNEMPAFPMNTGIPNQQNGMTLVDYFAGQALCGLCANKFYVGNKSTDIILLNNNELSEICYELANAMLAERERRNK